MRVVVRKQESPEFHVVFHVPCSTSGPYASTPRARPRDGYGRDSSSPPRRRVCGAWPALLRSSAAARPGVALACGGCKPRARPRACAVQLAAARTAAQCAGGSMRVDGHLQCTELSCAISSAGTTTPSLSSARSPAGRSLACRSPSARLGKAASRMHDDRG